MTTVATFNTNGVAPTAIVSSGTNNSAGLIVMEPLSTDIISGRGARGRNHVGTQAYRTLVQRNQARYSICPEREKRMISKSIVDTLLSDGRRFIGQHKGSGVGWYVMSFDEAVKKTSQALREGQPKRRESLVRCTTTATNPVDNVATATLSTPGAPTYVPPTPLVPAATGIGNPIPSSSFSQPTALAYLPYQAPSTLSQPPTPAMYTPTSLYPKSQPSSTYVQPPYYGQLPLNPANQTQPSSSQLHAARTSSNRIPALQYQQQQQQPFSLELKNSESVDDRTFSSDFNRFSISSVTVASNERPVVSDTHSGEETHQDIVVPSSSVNESRTEDAATVDVFSMSFCPVDYQNKATLSYEESRFHPSSTAMHPLPVQAIASRATSSSTGNTSDTISQKLSGRGLLLYAEQQKSLHEMSTFDGGEDISDLSLLQPLLVSSIRTCMTSAKSVIRDDMDISTNQVFYEPSPTNASSNDNTISAVTRLEQNLLPDFVLDDANERKVFVRGLGFDDVDIDVLTEFWAPSILSKSSPSSDRTGVGSGGRNKGEVRGNKNNSSLSDFSTEHVRIPPNFDQSAISMMSHPSALDVVHGKQQHKQDSANDIDPPVSAMRESFASMKRSRTAENAGNTAATSTDQGDVCVDESGRTSELNLSGMSDFSSFAKSYSQVLLAHDFQSDISMQNDIDEEHSGSGTDVNDAGDDENNHNNNDLDDCIPTRSNYERCNASRWSTSM